MLQLNPPTVLSSSGYNVSSIYLIFSHFNESIPCTRCRVIDPLVKPFHNKFIFVNEIIRAILNLYEIQFRSIICVLHGVQSNIIRTFILSLQTLFRSSYLHIFIFRATSKKRKMYIGPPSNVLFIENFETIKHNEKNFNNSND